MVKEAQDNRTATFKYNDKMPVNSDDNVTATGKRKQEKRSSDDQVPADLRQPKDPDPEPEPVALVEAEVKAILGDSITLTFLRNLCNDAVDEIGQGNERFRVFQDRYATRFSQPCLYFDDPFKSVSDIVSCEEAMIDIFKMQDNDSQSVIQLLVGLFDHNEEGEDIDDPYVWATRELVMRTAQQDPTTFFKIKEARSNPDSVPMHSFWSRSVSNEFRLRPDSVAVRFWVISSCLLGHPWRYYFHIQSPDPGQPRELDFPMEVQPVAEAQELLEARQKQLTPLEKQALAFQKYFSQKKQIGKPSKPINHVGKILDFESMETVKQNSSANGVLPKSKQSMNDKDDEVSVKQAKKKAKKKVGGVQFKDVVSQDTKSATNSNGKNKRKEKVNFLPSPDRARFRSEEGSKPSGKQGKRLETDDDEILVTKVIRHQHQSDDESSEDEIEYAGTKRGDDMEEEDGDGTSDLTMKKVEEKATEAEQVEHQQKASYAAVLNRQVHQPQASGTISDQIKKMTQVDVFGMPGLAWFYEVAFSMVWNGNQSGKSITKAWVKIIVEAIVEALKNSEDGLRLLPFSDMTYKDQKLWIRNERDCRDKIKTFRDLQKYIDMDYGNAQYTASNNKPGDKVFRTRMRFGFDEGVQQLNIQNYLNDGLKSLGSKSGCFPTLIQWGEQTKIGGFAFLPPEMNPKVYGKELMRKLGFKKPIVLKWEWANVPFDSSRMKWNDRQPGIRLWHAYVRTDDAYEIDQLLREWLHPNTEKKDLPWAAPVHYFSDWKTTEAEILSVKPCGLAKDKVLTLISRARDFQNLTTVLFSDSDFPGMLKKSETANFGQCSLLKMLLSVKASPDQAAVAEENAVESEGESMEEDAKDDDKGFKMVKKKQGKKELAKALESVTKDMTPAQVKAEADKEKKLLMDANNFMPSPLFLMVLPGEMEGTYILVVRLKYEQLGRNVLKGIVPFFVCHLGERSDAAALVVVKPWFSQILIDRCRRRRQRWSAQTARAEDGTATAGHDGLDDGLDFLDFGADILDSFRGLLSFDLEMANSKDIDDGATVAGAMDDFIETHAQLQDALKQVALQDEALANAEDENAKLRDRLARLEAQAEDDRRRWALQQQLGQHLPPGTEKQLSGVDKDGRSASDGGSKVLEIEIPNGVTVGQTVATPSRSEASLSELQSPPSVTRDQTGLLSPGDETNVNHLMTDQGFEPLDSDDDGGDPHGSPPPRMVSTSRPGTSSKLVSPDNETGSRGANGSTVEP